MASSDDDEDLAPAVQKLSTEELAQESAWAVVIAIVVSGFGALIAFSTVCAEQHACLKAGTCYVNSNATMSCGFRTAITPAGWRMLNASDQWSSLQAMNRGVCAPGLRQSVDPATGDLECVRKRSYPSALNEEIGDPAAAAGEDHRRWCGKWAAGAVAHASEGRKGFETGVKGGDRRAKGGAVGRVQKRPVVG